MAVVAALELDDLVAPGRGARHPHRAHRRLGARADEADPLHRRHQHRDALRQPGLELRRRAEAGAASPPRRRAPSAAPSARARGSADPTTSRSRCRCCRPTSSRWRRGRARRRADGADRLECAHRAVDAAGKDARRRGEQLLRARVSGAFLSEHPWDVSTGGHAWLPAYQPEGCGRRANLPAAVAFRLKAEATHVRTRDSVAFRLVSRKGHGGVRTCPAAVAFRLKAEASTCPPRDSAAFRLSAGRMREACELARPPSPSA